MATWLMDTPLFKLFASPKATCLQQWCEANDASLFVSAASLTEVAVGINKIPGSQSKRRQEMREWLDEIPAYFADRIHTIDPLIAIRAATNMPHLTNGHMRHRFHDALLVATAQEHGHGLLTRREGIFGAWTQTPLKII